MQSPTQAIVANLHVGAQVMQCEKKCRATRIAHPPVMCTETDRQVLERIDENAPMVRQDLGESIW
jgi:hypothetical protein